MAGRTFSFITLINSSKGMIELEALVILASALFIMSMALEYHQLINSEIINEMEYFHEQWNQLSR